MAQKNWTLPDRQLEDSWTFLLHKHQPAGLKGGRAFPLKYSEEWTQDDSEKTKALSNKESANKLNSYASKDKRSLFHDKPQVYFIYSITLPNAFY